LHISLDRRLKVWHPGLIQPGDDKDEASEKEFLQSDVLLPLLTVRYLNNEECVRRLAVAKRSQLQVIPLLVGPFDLEVVAELSDLKENIVPRHGTPLEISMNIDDACRLATKELREKVFGKSNVSDKLLKGDSKMYNLIWAALPIMSSLAFLIYGLSNDLDLGFTVLGSLLVATTAVFPIIRVTMPTNILNQQ